ncbi:MAG: Synechococcus phage [Bacteroidota bacterium]|jgi:hypothetical protein
MSVYVSNITIPVGADFNQTFILSNAFGNSLNLSGYTASSILKKHPNSSKTSAVFDVTFPDPRMTGQVRISLASTITSTLKSGRYCYDILVDDGNGERTRVIEGSALVTAGVTTTVT